VAILVNIWFNQSSGLATIHAGTSCDGIS